LPDCTINYQIRSFGFIFRLYFTVAFYPQSYQQILWIRNNPRNHLDLQRHQIGYKPKLGLLIDLYPMVLVLGLMREIHNVTNRLKHNNRTTAKWWRQPW